MKEKFWFLTFSEGIYKFTLPMSHSLPMSQKTLDLIEIGDRAEHYLDKREN